MRACVLLAVLAVLGLSTLASAQQCVQNQPCDDGDPSTTNDVCVNGVCRGTPIVCNGVLVNGACRAVCPQPVLPLRAVFRSCASFIEGSVCTFGCEAGFEPAGSQAGITCDAQGKWVGPDDFRCVLFTPEVRIDNGNMTFTVAPGQDIVFNLGATIESITAIRRRFDDVSNRITRVDADIRTTLSTADSSTLSAARIDSQDRANAARTGAVAEASSMVTSLSTSVSSSQRSLATDLNTQISSLGVQISQLQSTLTTTRTQIGSASSLPAGYTDHVGAINGISTLVSSLTRTVSDLNNSTNTRLLDLENRVSRITQCSQQGLAFNGTACVQASANFVPQNATCTQGALRYDRPGGRVLICDGTRFVPVFNAPLGSTDATAVPNCETMFSSYEWNGDGFYYIGTSGSTLRQYCQGSTNIGHDGSNATKVSFSCDALNTVFKRPNGVYFIDGSNPPSPSRAAQRFCENGVNRGGDGSSSANSALSCDTITRGFNRPYGRYWVNGVEVFCAANNPASCQDCRNTAGAAATSGVHEIVISGTRLNVWCEMVGSDGWTLAIRANPTNTLWLYDNAIWTNAQEVNAPAVVNGLDLTDFKSIIFNSMPIRFIRLGFRTVGLNDTVFSNMDLGFTSTLISLFGGPSRDINLLSRAAWLAAIPGGGSLQANCNRQGVNVFMTGTRTRLGIIGNQENDCLSPDSRIGIGNTGDACAQDPSSPVGNECRCVCSNGEVSRRFMGYLLVRP